MIIFQRQYLFELKKKTKNEYFFVYNLFIYRINCQVQGRRRKAHVRPVRPHRAANFFLDSYGRHRLFNNKKKCIFHRYSLYLLISFRLDSTYFYDQLDFPGGFFFQCSEDEISPFDFLQYNTVCINRFCVNRFFSICTGRQNTKHRPRVELQCIYNKYIKIE